jgi:hypothetical protein
MRLFLRRDDEIRGWRLIGVGKTSTGRYLEKLVDMIKKSSA